MKKVELGLSLMPEQEFLQAALPLFQNEEVDVIEWSFDTHPSYDMVPEWIKGLLVEYGKANKLIGHGVYYSLFAAKWTDRQGQWLAFAKEETIRNTYAHVSEHFGFMSSDNYHASFPLPVPLSKSILALGVDRLKRLADAVKVPVGIENLAFSFSEKDVHEQGVFVDKLTESIDGFILLDFHNIYCQAHNFDVDIMSLVKAYPLEKVKEIHVSGGSWQDSVYRKNKVRRDTHDGAVPEILFDILTEVIALCPNLEFVILERLGNTFNGENSMIQYRKDFKRIKNIIDSASAKDNSKQWGKSFEMLDSPIENIPLDIEQKKLVQLLRNKKDYHLVKEAKFEFWDVAEWDIGMIETASLISEKWMG